MISSSRFGEQRRHPLRSDRRLVDYHLEFVLVEALQLCYFLQHHAENGYPMFLHQTHPLLPQHTQRGICRLHQYNAMETIVVVVVGPCIRRLLHSDVLAIHSHQTVVVVSSGGKPGSNFLPLLFSFSAVQYFFHIHRNDGFTHLGNKCAYGTGFHPETVLQTFIGIPSG